MTMLVQAGSASAARSEPAPASAPELTWHTPDLAESARAALKSTGARAAEADESPRAADSAVAREAQASAQSRVAKRGAMMAGAQANAYLLSRRLTGRHPRGNFRTCRRKCAWARPRPSDVRQHHEPQSAKQVRPFINEATSQHAAFPAAAHTAAPSMR